MIVTQVAWHCRLSNCFREKGNYFKHSWIPHHCKVTIALVVQKFFKSFKDEVPTVEFPIFFCDY